MKIIITDGYTLNPGDLSWQGIENLGEVINYDRTPAADVAARCREAEIAITNKVPFSKETLAALPNLKLIAVTATGYNIVDTAAAAAQGIAVCNVPDYGTDSVAQHTFALLLELSNGVGKNSASVAAGGWVACEDFGYSKTPLMELAGKTMGLVGFGSIGRQTAIIARAFGMKVLYYTPRQKDTDLAEYRDLESLFKESDVVSLHCPLKSDNQQFVNRQLLQLMKPTAFLLNTARGQLINEAHLAQALNEGVIAGAGVDVLSAEPPVATNPLLSAKNIIITPHNAWMSKEARIRIMQITEENIKAFLDGKPQNRVN
ncbi:D-2-hydroxyacid dehydrogenase [Foetidibacter luteolus]|uniref:D-2-hydroxyacid dehydrogenase n=1 Tax=Foetidibacter luteolus TaxID=2608880 RepID=UPI00129B350F|nr:D-2-hydroxyacid dehydrogenase [Foetidibacter luteolus]